MVADDSLLFNSETGHWEGKAEVGSRAVSMRVDGGYLEIEVAPIVERVVARLEATWSDIEANLVRSLLATYNESWRDDDESELTAEAFLARITLDGAVVMEAESVTIWFRDDDLFYGHAIEIHIDADGKQGVAALGG